MRTVWDSPAWQSLPGNFSTTPGNLTFSYYIDWFNPFMNKIARKSASCGAIMLFCLNLPPDIQQLPENTFFAGITPPPKEPTMTTITAVADPIIDCLKPMWDGRLIKTYRHPLGIQKRVAILARIGDLLAIRKAMGFAGVASHNFCSFCKLHLADIDDLNHLSWVSRSGADVLRAANEWKNADTKKRRKEIYKEHGVRWSSLHGLPYGDAVCHTLLGIMHNWIEGVLQHHARVLWGIGVVPPKTGNHNDHNDHISAVITHPLLDADLNFGSEVLDDEIEDLYVESQSYQDTPSHMSRMRSEASILSQDCDDSDPEDVDFQPDGDSDSASDDSGDEDESWKANCIFTAAELNMIHACISEAVIPSWIERPPRNLGEKAHGKLKADQWFVLFSVFLPLVIPEMWQHLSDSRHCLLMNNFYDLITCTNIVCAYAVTPGSADTYLDHYIKYRESCQILFPNIGSRPNHHYAMHNPELMKFWGPMMPLSEFGGERLNGHLQKIKTNSHLCE